MPYLFADQWRLLRRGGSGPDRAATDPTIDVAARPYRLFLYALATVPSLGLVQGFATMQRLYAITGAAFMPILASALLALLGSPKWAGKRGRNRWTTNLVLLAVLAFFALLFWDVVA